MFCWLVWSAASELFDRRLFMHWSPLLWHHVYEPNLPLILPIPITSGRRSNLGRPRMEVTPWWSWSITKVRMSTTSHLIFIDLSQRKFDISWSSWSFSVYQMLASQNRKMPKWAEKEYRNDIKWEVMVVHLHLIHVLARGIWGPKHRPQVDAVPLNILHPHLGGVGQWTTHVGGF
jgi:hypothetical protein